MDKNDKLYITEKGTLKNTFNKIIQTNKYPTNSRLRILSFRGFSRCFVILSKNVLLVNRIVLLLT